jgi:hypothetical protein
MKDVQLSLKDAIALHVANDRIFEATFNAI